MSYRATTSAAHCVAATCVAAHHASRALLPVVSAWLIIRYGRLLCSQVADRADEASPHRMQRLRGEAVWDADNARELGGPHHTHSAVRGGRAGIVDNPWVIGGCSGTRV